MFGSSCSMRVVDPPCAKALGAESTAIIVSRPNVRGTRLLIAPCVEQPVGQFHRITHTCRELPLLPFQVHSTVTGRAQQYSRLALGPTRASGRLRSRRYQAYTCSCSMRTKARIPPG